MNVEAETRKVLKCDHCLVYSFDPAARVVELQTHDHEKHKKFAVEKVLKGMYHIIFDRIFFLKINNK